MSLLRFAITTTLPARGQEESPLESWRVLVDFFAQELERLYHSARGSVHHYLR